MDNQKKVMLGARDALSGMKAGLTALEMMIDSEEEFAEHEGSGDAYMWVIYHLKEDIARTDAMLTPTSDNAS